MENLSETVPQHSTAMLAEIYQQPKAIADTIELYLQGGQLKQQLRDQVREAICHSSRSSSWPVVRADTLG